MCFPFGYKIRESVYKCSCTDPNLLVVLMRSVCFREEQLVKSIKFCLAELSSASLRCGGCVTCVIVQLEWEVGLWSVFKFYIWNKAAKLWRSTVLWETIAIFNTFAVAQHLSVTGLKMMVLTTSRITYICQPLASTTKLALIICMGIFYFIFIFWY